MKRIILYILILYALIISCSFSNPLIIKAEKPLSPKILSTVQTNIEKESILLANLEFNYYIFLSDNFINP